jgi:hypothetical protein
LLGKVWDENTDPFTTAIRSQSVRCAQAGRAPIIETVYAAGYQIGSRLPADFPHPGRSAPIGVHFPRDHSAEYD